MSNIKYRVAGMCGNLLEHYDNALFGLLAPFIAPLFFDKTDPLTALIWTYAMLPLGIITRPLGSLFFGWVGDRRGRRQALIWALLGMGVVTVGMGFLPTYGEVGPLAAVLLAVGRMCQSFCAAGEAVGGALLVLENTREEKRSVMSGLFDATTVGGILVASGLVWWMTRGGIGEGWRVLFWLGGVPAFFGVYLRLKGDVEFRGSPQRLGEVLFGNGKALIGFIFASGFFYTTYALPFTLMNGFAPLITGYSKEEVVQVNTLLLIVDMLLLPCFGYVAGKVGKERVMLFASASCAAVALPLFYCLGQGSMAMIIFVRLVIIVLGVAFAASYYAWGMERVQPQHRFTVMALGGAIGSQLIGYPAAAICLWLYKKTGWICAPGIYLLCSALAACFTVLFLKKERNDANVFNVDKIAPGS